MKSKHFLFQIFKKGKLILMDQLHVIGFGTTNAIDKKILKEHCGEIQFNLELLQQAHDYFKGIFGKNFDPFYVKVFLPKKSSSPILFTCWTDNMGSRKQVEIFYAVAPMREDDGS